MEFYTQAIRRFKRILARAKKSRLKEPTAMAPALSEKFDEALKFASSVHRDQMRKGTTISYITHLLAVSARFCTTPLRTKGLRYG